ncbi:MAG: phage integrase Arm DNA-binding domain-containing protein [Ramlibacter sp.]|nr:phage integrase Arm DNA-binding domain-containing protein [Ramlibacter sp.]
MASRPRSRSKRNWPEGLYERNGYFSWRNPLTGVEMGIGRMPEREAIAQASEANVEVAGLRNKPRLIDRLTGRADRSFRAWLEAYSQQLGLADDPGAPPPDRKLAFNTRKTYRSMVKRIRETYAESLDLPLEKVTTLIIAAGIRAVKAEHSRSAQSMRSRLGDIFDSAIAAGWTTTNPVTVTDEVCVTVKRARLSWEVFTAALEAAEHQSTKNAAILALVSGQPREVIVAATFADVGPLERPGAEPVECWKFCRGKTGAMIAIPLDLRLNIIGMSLRDVIKQCRGTNVASKFMIHHTERRKESRRGSAIAIDRLTKDFTAAITALGMDWGKANPPTFHEIRSLSKRLYGLQGGVNTKELLGHKTEQMSDLYADERGMGYKLVSLG